MYIFQQNSITLGEATGDPWEWQPTGVATPNRYNILFINTASISSRKVDEKYGRVNLRASEPRTSEPPDK